ncbi:MAG: hypothetical protein AMXMBFR84_42820 [Candidatus Hydrogenedentota bacterium]
MTQILKNKHYDRPSVFEPANLLEAARRQRTLPSGAVPDVCVLDPDGDLFRHLRESGAPRNPYWACYHTELYEIEIDGETAGVLGCAVGASFAVLVAEELFNSGCRVLISITSAGQIVPAGQPPYFVLIDRALRDEGTSYHYLPPTTYVNIPKDMLAVGQTLVASEGNIVQGGVWTTDAPFRETEEAIAFARSEGLLAVEMEAAALYALAEAKNVAIVCFAHVTNQLATVENDFEKGEKDGNTAMVDLISRVVRQWREVQ